MGTCRLGLKCRFLGGHMRKVEDGTVLLVEDEEKKEHTLTENTELNFISPTAMKLLRTKKVRPISPTNLGSHTIKQRSIRHQYLIDISKS
jgi:hypothetical protein